MKILIKDNPTIKKAEKEYKHFTSDSEMLQLKEDREKYWKDYNTNILAAEKRGKMEGEMKGKIEGKIEGKMETVKIMIEKNVDWKFITEITGITKEQYEKWVKR